MAYKTKYTYKGIEFASASKVVARKASKGDLLGAYKTHLDNTIMRNMRRNNVPSAIKSQWFLSLSHGYHSEEEAKEALKIFKAIHKDTRQQMKEYRSERREIVKEAERVGMSKKSRGSLKYKMYRKGITNEEGREIVDSYIRDEVAPIIRENIYGQYASVFAMLRDSDDPDLKQLMRNIQDAIDYYSTLYVTNKDSQQMLAKELKSLIQNVQYWESLSEKAVTAIEHAMDSYDKVQAQIAVKNSFKNTQLNQE